MVATKRRIGDRLGYYGADGQYRTHREIHAKPRVPVSRRIGHAWRTLNKPREFIFTPGKGMRAIFLLVLLGLGILFTADQLLKPSSVYAVTPEAHPGQDIWRLLSTQGNLDPFNCRLASWNSTVGGITVNANTTHTALCITKSKIDMSTVSGRELWIGLDWYLSSNPGNYPYIWGWFFTTNNTVPNETAEYIPETDVEVAMLRHSLDSGGGNYASTLFIQRQEGQAISDINFGCNASGSVYLCATGTSFPANSGVSQVANTLLNYTGNPNDPGHNSQINDNNVRTNQDDLNWFQFATVPYYLGFFARPRSPDPIGVSFVTPSVQNKIMPATPQPPPQNIDTGGFFGPIIRALIQIGVIALAFIAQFLGYLADAILVGLNAMGNSLGLDNIGTAIRDTFTGFVTYISNVLSVTVGQAVNLGTAFGNVITTVVTSASSFFAGLTGFFAEVTSLFSQFWTIVGTIFKFGNLGFKWLIMLDLIAGIMMAMKSVQEFRNWIWIQWTVGLGLLRVIVAIANGVTDLIAKIRTIGPRPMGI